MSESGFLGRDDAQNLFNCREPLGHLVEGILAHRFHPSGARHGADLIRSRVRTNHGSHFLIKHQNFGDAYAAPVSDPVTDVAPLREMHHLRVALQASGNHLGRILGLRGDSL